MFWPLHQALSWTGSLVEAWVLQYLAADNGIKHKDLDTFTDTLIDTLIEIAFRLKHEEFPIVINQSEIERALLPTVAASRVVIKLNVS